MHVVVRTRDMGVVRYSLQIPEYKLLLAVLIDPSKARVISCHLTEIASYFAATLIA